MRDYRKAGSSRLFNGRTQTFAAAIIFAAAMVASHCFVEPVVAGMPDAGGNKRLEQEAEYVPGEVLVLVSGDLDRNGEIGNAEGLVGVEAAMGGSVEKRLALSRGKEVIRVKLPEGKTVEDAIAENWGARDRRILAVEANYLVRIARVPEDLLFDDLWGLHNTGQTGGTSDADIDAPEAWDIATGVPAGSDVIVGVIDTGIDYMHPDLAANMWINTDEIPGNGMDDDLNGYIDDIYGYDFYLDDSDPSDAAGHGTHCAGTIAAVGDNGIGVAGVNWRCKLMALRFLNANGSGSTSDAVEAVIYGVNNGAKILSNSWGGGGYSDALEAAIMYARDNGVLFVAAAGNGYGTDTDANPYYPAGYDVSNVISVAATDHRDLLASFSNIGAETVDLGAPGSSILSTMPNFRTLFYENFQGASIPTFAGTQMEKLGDIGNRWGTVAVPMPDNEDNVAARGDWGNSRPYLGSSSGSMVTPVIDTRGLRGLTLEFNYRYEVGLTDELGVYIWDGMSWQMVFSRSSNCCYYDDFYYWIRMDIPESYRNENMQVRFRWFTDVDDNNYFGGEIDNILIQCIDDNEEFYGYYSGTSMATPHVAGVAALLMANPPGTTPISLQELKNRLVWTGDPIPALDGKTVSGCRLNAYNALTAAPGVTVAVPNGGESWEMSYIYDIKWYSIEGGPTVDIYLLKGGEVYEQLADDTENDGKFRWEIPVSIAGDTDYRIRVSDGTTTDVSDDDFELFCPPMAIPSFPEPADGAVEVSVHTNLTWLLRGTEPTTITFDEVSYGTFVNGMVIGDVTFGFSSLDATINGGPGNTAYIQTPNIEGDTEGILTLEFDIPVYGVSYGFALSMISAVPLPDASTMVLLDSSYQIIGTFSTEASDMGYTFAEGFNIGTSTKPIAVAIITFSPPSQMRFALDNVSYSPIPGGLPDAATQGGSVIASASGSGEGDTKVWLKPGDAGYIQPEFRLPGVRLNEESGEKECSGCSSPAAMGAGADDGVGILHRGGPDDGDYIFIDSDEPNGPTFDWIDLPTLPPPNIPPPPPPPPPGASEPESSESSDPKVLSAMNLHLSDDSHFYPFMLPFSFPFYGAKYNNLAIGSNGAIYFVDEYFDLGNSCIPSSYYIQSFIAVYWDDLYPNVFGDDNVYVAIVGEAPSRIFVVQWERVMHCCSDNQGRVTCQAQLFEGSGDILMLYKDPSLEAGSGATVGIQRDSSCGLNYLCNQQILHPGLAILFQHKPPCPETWDVYFGEDPNAMELIGSDMTTTVCDPTPEPADTLKRGTKYYWQVVMKNCCSIVDGNEWSFTTENTRPIADAGDEQTIECVCNTIAGTQVTLDGTGSFDADGSVLTYTWTGPFAGSPAEGAAPTVTLDGGCPGEYVVTLIVNDGIEDSEPNEVLITVVDTTPPAFELSVTPTFLWPPDHKMEDITPSWTVSDECDASPEVSLVGVVANEGDDIIGGGNTIDDIEIGDDGSIQVRSERSGPNSGRIYTITYQAVDDSGNSTVRSATVSIPHDFRVLARIANRWLLSNSSGTIHVDFNGDGVVNLKDYTIFANNWILE